MVDVRAFQRSSEQDPSSTELPYNIELEQNLLGALLINNEVFSKIEGVVAAEHFFDPVHAKIFGLISDRIRANTIASPITLKVFLENDPGLAGIGGPAYLARLAGSATSIFASRDYAKIIHDLAIRRSLISLGEEISMKAARVDADTEPEEQIVEAEQQLYQLGEHGRIDRGFRSLRKALTESVDIATAAYQRGSGLAGLATGLHDLDHRLGGLHKSDLVILAGRPSMGKTALATNIAFHIATHPERHGTNGSGSDKVQGGVVGFFSLEMSREQLATRILADLARTPSNLIRQGRVERDDFRKFVEAANRFEAAPLFIDDTPALPINQVASRSRRLKRTHGLDLIVVDYLQLVRPTNLRDSRVNEITEITQGLKALAKELDVPVLALSQLSRQVENRDDKRPMLSDLRESGSIEQDADVVMFVFREEYYEERKKPSEDDGEKLKEWLEKMEKIHGVAEVIIGKQRHGPIGTVELSFESQFTRFGNLARDRDKPAYGAPAGTSTPGYRATRSPAGNLPFPDDDDVPI